MNERHHISFCVAKYLIWICVCVSHMQVIDECLAVDPTERPTATALLQANRFTNSVGESDAQGREVMRLCSEAHGGRPAVAPRERSESSDGSGSASVSSSFGAALPALLRNTTRSSHSDSTLSSSFNVVESDSKLCALNHSNTVTT